MSIFDLSGRTAVITGGNGGIGLGIAQALNAQGCNVSIWGRNGEKNKSAAATMSAGPGKVDTRICDVSDPASVKAAMKATLDTFGRVDGCFANAGIGGGGRRAHGLRRHRGVHHEQGVVVSYGRLLCDRWRVYGVLRSP